MILLQKYFSLPFYIHTLTYSMDCIFLYFQINYCYFGDEKLPAEYFVLRGAFLKAIIEGCGAEYEPEILRPGAQRIKIYLRLSKNAQKCLWVWYIIDMNKEGKRYEAQIRVF